MKYFTIILFAIWTLFSLSGCNNWLDVRPDTEQKDYDQFSTIDGFFDALVGTYIEMADGDAYGERLSISNIESLANLWLMPENYTSAGRLEDWYLTMHDFTANDARSAIAAFHAQLFRIIANANLIIKYTDEHEEVFIDKTMLEVIRGEAYAIRAYCQLDILRLFGQLPQGATQQVSLPYSYTTSIYEMPAYYDFTQYAELLKDDLLQAENCLQDNDPLFEYSFEELATDNENIPDNHLLYRQFRLNYWAVKALQARMHLYLGETNEAYNIAKEIIEAKDPQGNPVREMSGASDIPNGYRLCPNECLFALSKYDIMTSTEGFLIGGNDEANYSSDALAITQETLTELYAGELTEANNRYNDCWNKNVRDILEQPGYVATMKYWWDDNTEETMFNCQLVPMLRMSEVYLIGMETSENLSEVNQWYKEYMVAHNVGTSTDFASLELARKWVQEEYRREFIAEGQSFYTYKRTASPTMVGAEEGRIMSEIDYILPLPQTEYNPNNL